MVASGKLPSSWTAGSGRMGSCLPLRCYSLRPDEFMDPVCDNAAMTCPHLP